MRRVRPILASRILSALVLAAAAFSAVGCQTFEYQIWEETADGGRTQIDARRQLMPWTEFDRGDVRLWIDVRADGSWTVATGDEIDNLMQNPEIAKAIAQGVARAVATAVAKAMTMGLWSP